MPKLSASLNAFEIDQLQQTALVWGLVAAEEDKTSLVLSLELQIPDPRRFASVFGQLPEPARQALFALRESNGMLAWSTFAQRFGEIRALGKTLRKKEQPWAFPASTSETLWYHGMLGRDFLRVNGELQEMAYLPDELIPLLPAPPEQPTAKVLEPVSIETYESFDVFPTSSTILDEVCLLLAALRFENPEKYLAKTTFSTDRWEFLEKFLTATGVLDQEKQPTDLARKFLELPRVQALIWLGKQWLKSDTFAEITCLPGLQIESSNPIRSQSARQIIFTALHDLEEGRWYALDEFVELVRATVPDFLRQQEEYFSWHVVKEGSVSEILSGYESWQEVEGALITFIVLRMLPWLGLTDIARQKGGESRQFFRLKGIFFNLENPRRVAAEENENEPISLTSAGKIVMTNRSPRMVRYQISRFVEWLEVSPSQGSYQITPTSLTRAEKQGLLAKHLINLLRKNADGGLPPILYEAIKRWETEGTQASVQTQTILRLGSPQLLQALRESPAAHWLGESLGPTAVIIKPAGEKAVWQALSSLGYLADFGESEQ